MCTVLYPCFRHLLVTMITFCLDHPYPQQQPTLPHPRDHLYQLFQPYVGIPGWRPPVRTKQKKLPSSNSSSSYVTICTTTAPLHLVTQIRIIPFDVNWFLILCTTICTTIPTSWDGIPEWQFYLMFLGINWSLLRLEFLSDLCTPHFSVLQNGIYD